MVFTQENMISNLNLCYNAAEKIGIPKLLDAEDFLEVTDQKCIVTYLTWCVKRILIGKY
jgi:hypothetical protein